MTPERKADIRETWKPSDGKAVPELLAHIDTLERQAAAEYNRGLEDAAEMAGREPYSTYVCAKIRSLLTKDADLERNALVEKVARGMSKLHGYNWAATSEFWLAGAALALAVIEAEGWAKQHHKET